MEEVAAVRRAALDAVDDVEPGDLRDRIRARLDDGSMAPGVLAMLSARAAADATGDDTGPSTFPAEAAAERGAGVQLIYEGLRLTRALAQDPPWERARSLTDGAGDAAEVDPGSPPENAASPPVEATDLTDVDMAILVADIMVARGFYLLARTDAAGNAVATVQAFGSDQTTRRAEGDASLDRNLERDVFELAAVAGTTAVGGAASDSLREYAASLADEGPLPLADGLFSDATVGELARHTSGVATSGDD